MADIMGIGDLGFAGSRKAIGKLVIEKDINPAKVTKETKAETGITTITEDSGRFQRVKKVKSSGEVISDRFIMKLGVDVNGSVTYFKIFGEDEAKSPNKKFKTKEDKDSDAVEVNVKFDEAEQYALKCTNPIYLDLFTIEEMKELKIPFQDVNKDGTPKTSAIKFVTNRALIVFLCKYREAIRNKRVEVTSNLSLDIYKGNVSVEKGVAFMKTIKKTDITTDIHVIESPVIFPVDAFESVKVLACKDNGIKVAFLTQVQKDGEYVKKFVYTNSFLHLNKIMSKIELPEEVYANIIANMKGSVANGTLKMASIEIVNGASEEEITTTDPLTNLMLNDPNTPQEIKDELMATLKATKKRGYAKIIGHIIETNDPDGAYEIKPEDFNGATAPNEQASSPVIEPVTSELGTIGGMNLAGLGGM